MGQENESSGTVLVVDDDPGILALIQTVLSAANYRVLLAGGGKDAVRLAGQKHLDVDVALLDIRMPGMRPTELADEILRLRPNISMMFMSGFVDDEGIWVRIREACWGFLPKPFRPDCLLQAVHQAMKRASHGHGAGRFPAYWAGAGQEGVGRLC